MEAALAKFEVAEQVAFVESEVGAGADEQTTPAQSTECSDDKRVEAPAGMSTASLVQRGQTIRTRAPARGVEAWCPLSADAPPPVGMACVNELCGWQRADGPAGSQEARAKLLTQLSELVASDEELRDASTDARAHTVLAYLNVFQQLRTADWEAAQIILAALQAEGLSPERASPLQAIQGLLMVVHDGTKAHGCRGNFVGLDIDSGR